MSSPYTVRWGIISTGGIATSFTKDLLTDPSTRNVSDVKHVVAAVGSRSVASAQKFIDGMKDLKDDQAFGYGVKNGALDGTKPYGSYDEVFADPNVDVVYIGTPHTYHYANTKAALLAGKNVLCEKPFTYNVQELDELVAIAKEKNLFLMEAVWTRFQPIAYEVQDIIHSGKLGKVKRFSADFFVDHKIDSLDQSHRIIDPKLGGGAVLDLGPYPSVWAMLILHQHPDNADRKPPTFVNSTQTTYKRTNVDADSQWRVVWDNVAKADLAADLTVVGLKDQAVVVQCELGDLIIDWPPFRPMAYTIVPHPSKDVGNDSLTDDSVKEKTRREFPPHVGSGMQYEADEVARNLRDGRKESARMPHSESRIVQSWFDEVRTRGETALKDIKNPTA